MNRNQLTIIGVFILGYVMCVINPPPLAHADGSQADAQNRRARALEEISSTLKEMNRKIK